MENKLEQLLNSLVEAGWKPRGLLNEIEYIHAFNDVNQGWRVEISYGDHGYYKALRHIVAKESGLWQFCIAKHLLKKYSDLGDDDEYVIGRWQNGMDGKTTDGEYIDENYDSDIYHQDESYQYRLIESALCNEEALEKFLLDNIKV